MEAEAARVLGWVEDAAEVLEAEAVYVAAVEVVAPAVLQEAAEARRVVVKALEAGASVAMALVVWEMEVEEARVRGWMEMVEGEAEVPEAEAAEVAAVEVVAPAVLAAGATLGSMAAKLKSLGTGPGVREVAREGTLAAVNAAPRVAVLMVWAEEEESGEVLTVVAKAVAGSEAVAMELRRCLSSL